MTSFDQHVADVNERIAAEGRCVLHHSDVNIAAMFLLKLSNGNELPLCRECCEWWVANPEDPASRPSFIVPFRAVEVAK